MLSISHLRCVLLHRCSWYYREDGSSAVPGEIPSRIVSGEILSRIVSPDVKSEGTRGQQLPTTEQRWLIVHVSSV